MIEGIRWLSFGPKSGYGCASEAYLSGLRTAGIPVCWTPLGWPSTVWPAPLGPLADPDLGGAVHRDIANRRVEHDTVVVHSPPFWHDRMADEAEGRLLVAFTAWETDRLPDEWLDILGHFDRVVVPSRFNADVFASSGLTVPIAVVPHIARPVPTPERGAPKRAEDSRFVVYLVATWSTRKAILDAVEAFVTAFDADDEVVLIIHTTPEDLVARGRPATGERPPSRHEGSSWFTLAGALAGRSDLPDIVLSTRTLCEAEMDDLHRRGDCYLSLSRGEGWGLGAFDAAAWGKPVVVTGWGAAPEFLPDGYPYFVDYDLVATTTDESDALWQPRPGERWAKARVSHAATLLRDLYEHRDEACAWGCLSQSHVLGNFDSITVTRQLVAALDAQERPHMARPPVDNGAALDTVG
jgi:glycosyltransferase involved in cell wall biosynthesis